VIYLLKKKKKTEGSEKKIRKNMIVRPLILLLDNKYRAVGDFGLINYRVLPNFVSMTLCRKEAAFQCKKL